MATKRVKLIKTLVRGKPGTTFKAFGHKFEIQPDGSAVAEVDEAFVEAEVKAGRYVLIEDEFKSDFTQQQVAKGDFNQPDKITVNQKGGETKVLDKNPLAGFGSEVSDWFGCKSASELRKKISKLKKDEVRLLAENRLRFHLPERMGKDRMVSEIVKTVEASIEAAKENSP